MLSQLRDAGRELMFVTYQTHKRIVRWVGFRGSALVLFGCVYLAIGISTLGERMVDPRLFHTLLPIWFRVGLWTCTGVAAIICAFYSRPRFQIVGYGILFAAPCERLLSFFFALVREVAEQPGWMWLMGGCWFLIVMVMLGVAVATSGHGRRRRHWAAALSALGGVALSVMTAFLVVSQVLPVRWVSGTAVYFLLCALVALLAAWPEPPPETTSAHRLEVDR